MTIQYLSDLHMEFKDNLDYLRRLPLEVTGDVLVVAGDCIYLGDEGMAASPFWQWASDHYAQVMLVPGNHEYYGGHDVTARGDAWEWKLKENVGYYQNRVVTVGDTDFILSTLWSHISRQHRPSVSYFLNDFHRITYRGRPFTTADYNAEHARCLAFVKRAVAASTARHRVVVTHHVPTALCSPQKLNVIRDGALKDAFTVDLTRYIRTAPIDCWIYGHSHVSIPAEIGGTRVVGNQLGYVHRRENEWNGFRFGASVSL